MNINDYLTVKETADLLGVSAQTIRQYIKNGTLPAIKIGDYRISRKALDELAGCGSAIVAISEAVAERLMPRLVDAMRQALRQSFLQPE